MREVSPDQLKQAIESQLGGTATLVRSVPVREAHHGMPIWEGLVHVFDLAGHSKATRAYAWSSPKRCAASAQVGYPIGERLQIRQ